MSGMRFYSNWEILAECVLHPFRTLHWWRHGSRPRLNGWWFRNPYR